MDAFKALFDPATHISVDDAGVRCVSARAAEWLPFASLADAEAGWNLLGRPFLRLVSRDGRERLFRVTRDELLDAQEAILRGLREVKAASPSDQALSATLGRAGRPLTEWLAAVSAWASGGSGYRSSAVGPEALIATLRDPSADVELRAASVHAALACGGEPEIVAIATTFVDHPLPPLVVAAARLGRGGAALVPDGMLDDVAPLLSDDDRSATRSAMAAPVTHEGEAHVHDLMANAARDVILARTRMDRGPRRRIHAMSLGGYADQQGVTRFK